MKVRLARNRVFFSVGIRIQQKIMYPFWKSFLYSLVLVTSWDLGRHDSRGYRSVLVCMTRRFCPFLPIPSHFSRTSQTRLASWLRPAIKRQLFFFGRQFLNNFFNIYLFLIERERWAGEGQREGDGESEAGSVLTAVSSMWGSTQELRHREIMTWAEVRC